ncbi:MAG: DNA-directed RNA polymerase subunit alpha [Acidimicrobiia bacterium BACL6 MAG-121220-bin61]|jgi:DNA-directed RNA polymerase subunit alpha|uniref:DNA-directed RNA polymerase subunit alpha n=1 Tax=Acidimicrobiia bacterium BACL6 MAG-120924-bin43 TaxID=1655583 RepID=A0A0R2QKY5_9ACTN|nr:MAG: DNA-directed RNA polymerase subunit alpha [Acidimicrobiia bacterium BACL6 MAG-120924-bin43]KRO52830.1 MAG: DNA-directed RNA polymerase subunit alpha [Acidimicrobiia bacterium BACL6 MAG-120910-bin40]KRO65741.1 MAG: DNA-directed RNA polymerase subunit alpha [Acidimicrobiia bacterium BACL6 MAG-121220-bin61]HAG66993.1 DNA-directed RNA polymerase subunit alpha [Acidimicrobium sp.]
MLVIQRPSVEAIGTSDNNRQKFSIGPLDPGLGHTIGNSLRRMLLSSIPGAAISTVKFESALHEFDTIEGITEDVTEIILNLKDVVVMLDGDEPVVITVDVKGPADVSAADIVCPTGVTILNPSQHIATLSAKGRLVVDITVERGKGYSSSDRDTRKVIGVIPIDAIYSPVRRCTYIVEPTRVEQSTNFDKIILDIETDGSIAPQEALASAGATLRSLVDLVATMSDAPMALELGEISTSGMGSPDLDLSIEDLDLSERPRNCLKRAQVNTIGELLLRSDEDLLNITNFGQKSLDEIKLKLDERGLSLRL